MIEPESMVELPDDLPVVEREVVRLVVLDAEDKVLLFHTHDPTYPELGQWWELPGGGMEAGETYRDAAVRELLEETGIAITADLVGAATWSRRASFRYRGRRHLQNEVVAIVRLSGSGPAIDGSQRVEFEDDDYFDFRWWPVAEVISSGERFYPGRLPKLLGALLDGEIVEEPFELWS